ncbi:hypothetical protein FOYG_13873 [Fusarium oxysporum NRRL 32931]|uniref:Uncharacterized protein n=1 Tax=Fusarium oxysporum NRRL 32931 TaxID=660029 RepID=W9HV70_FUSOX|nr:hypothetical protein FOYG_13873 [Fusarium oxysporum NRRL 32931]
MVKGMASVRAELSDPITAILGEDLTSSSDDFPADVLGRIEELLTHTKVGAC